MGGSGDSGDYGTSGDAEAVSAAPKMASRLRDLLKAGKYLWSYDERWGERF